MEVKQIEPQDTYQIRNQILRPGLAVETCHFEKDHDDLTFHLGAYIEGELCSVASFYLDRNSYFSQEYQFRLRGMATIKKYQKSGLSSALLKAAFPLIQKNHVSLLWCNARVSAQGFYEKVGFEAHGDIFDIEGVGPHVLMSYTI